ncbi:amidase domain-containing protein [Amnibacterium flavum]|uniref:Putative amidase domain-containing protein n=1 Tax=Amnibacterium flavum TaxID=2173173 RepID=A0A2V1HWL1_9MICO|nr:amidase domain-containing protein [Amnibacterium flavum]PVZ95550.1 hypothetical protein DDQ50_03360 [Amnibacterium flavum]
MSSSRLFRRSALLFAPVLVATLALTACSPESLVGDASSTSRESKADASTADAELSDSVQAQVDYVLSYWSDYNPEYGTLGDDDCVNFTSQSLLERGWVQDDEWFYGGESVWDSSPAWISSTAFNDYLASRTDLVTALDDSQREQVVVGDIVQFDWDNSGDRDHTGVVTRVETTDEGIVVSFAGHTEDSDYRSVDTAITVNHPGASVYYWHILDD